MIVEDLKEKMRDKKVSQNKLADELEVTNVTIHKWLSGKVRLKVADLERIANYLGYDLKLVEKNEQTCNNTD